jgi:uncharacterized SAM-binding protein YcdF (DUF218 family)
MVRLFSQIAMWLLVCMGLWLAGLGWFIQQIPTTPVNALPNADAIVVLTGARGRVEHGLQLLVQNKGKALFISGARDGVTLATLLDKMPSQLRRTMSSRYGNKLPITLGHEAENTIGNARETAQWLSQNNYRSVLLVTSNYHMPRSLGEFREALAGITITPAPVVPRDFILAGGMEDDNDRALLMSEYHKFLASQLRHAFLSVTAPQ